jgi:hypothetical protein
MISRHFCLDSGGRTSDGGCGLYDYRKNLPDDGLGMCDDGHGTLDGGRRMNDGGHKTLDDGPGRGDDRCKRKDFATKTPAAKGVTAASVDENVESAAFDTSFAVLEIAPLLSLSLQSSRKLHAAEDFAAGFQRSTGLRAAAASSSRPMRVECGAFRTVSGSSTASRAIERIASIN